MAQRNRLSYAIEPPNGERIGIERFPDGGITASVPGAPKTSWLEQIVILLILLCVITVVFVLSMGTTKAMVFWRMLTRMANSPRGLLLTLGPVLIVLASIPYRIWQGGRRSVIGISPNAVYVDSCEGWFRRRIETARSNLKDVTVAHGKSRIVRGVEITFRDRRSILVCRFCREAESTQVVAELKEAMNRTEKK